jgi:hypothetical protein
MLTHFNLRTSRLTLTKVTVLAALFVGLVHSERMDAQVLNAITYQNLQINTFGRIDPQTGLPSSTIFAPGGTARCEASLTITNGNTHPVPIAFQIDYFSKDRTTGLPVYEYSVTWNRQFKPGETLSAFVVLQTQQFPNQILNCPPEIYFNIRLIDNSVMPNGLDIIQPPQSRTMVLR